MTADHFDPDIREKLEEMFLQVSDSHSESLIIEEGDRNYVLFHLNMMRTQVVVPYRANCACYESGKLVWYLNQEFNERSKRNASVSAHEDLRLIWFERHDEKFLKAIDGQNVELLISKNTGKSYSESEVIRQMLGGETEL